MAYMCIDNLLLLDCLAILRWFVTITEFVKFSPLVCGDQLKWVPVVCFVSLLSQLWVEQLFYVKDPETARMHYQYKENNQAWTDIFKWNTTTTTH